MSVALKCKRKLPGLSMFWPPSSKLWRSQTSHPDRHYGDTSILEMQRRGKGLITQNRRAVPGTGMQGRTSRKS